VTDDDDDDDENYVCCVVWVWNLIRPSKESTYTKGVRL